MSWLTRKSNVTTMLFCFAGATVFSGCSSSSNSSSNGTGGTTAAATGGATSATSTTAAATGGAAHSTGGTTGTGTGKGNTGGAAAGCTSVDTTASSAPSPIINIELVPAEQGNQAYTQVAGYPWDGPPVPEALVKDGESGACQVLKVVTYTCNPPACNATAVTCTGDNQWTRNPVKKADGTLAFSGVKLESGGTDFTLSAIGNLYQPTASTSVAYPPCAAGDKITVSGGTGSNAYSIDAKCVAPLEMTSTTPMAFESGKNATFTWTPGPDATVTTVDIEIDISHHGGLKGLIRCSAPDTGSITVDGSLITKLIGYGTAGFPNAAVTRRSRATASAGAGTATLDVKSTTTIDLEIPGVVSCNNDTKPCASGRCVSAKCQQ